MSDSVGVDDETKHDTVGVGAEERQARATMTDSVGVDTVAEDSFTDEHELWDVVFVLPAFCGAGQFTTWSSMA